MKIGKVCFAVLIIVMMFPALSVAVTYNGMLSSAGPNSQLILATGAWDQSDPEKATTIEWWVTQNGTIWHYDYVLNADLGEFSHVIFETSSNFGTLENDIFNVSVNGDTSYNKYFITTWQEPDPGSPNLPGDVYGIKFDEVSGLELRISFDSQRQPMWGDFYAKDGKAGTKPQVDNTCWNEGFALGEQAGLLGNDPTADADSGSLYNHILVPDTKTTPPVPEAGTMVMAGIGLTTMFSGLRFGKKLRRGK